MTVSPMLFGIGGTLRVRRILSGPYHTRWVDGRALYAVFLKGRPVCWFERDQKADMEEMVETLNREAAE
jgi:hypothetical protein